MRISRVDLKLVLKPKLEELYASAFLTINKPSKVIELMLNNQLEWLEISTEVKNKRYYLEASEGQLPEDSLIKISKLWLIELPPELHDLDELFLSFSYKGSIEGDSWGTNYLTKDRIELGIYVAYYPIHNIDDKIAFSLVLQGPGDWDWIVNSTKFTVCDCNIWVSDEPKTDIYLVGLPKELAISEEDSVRFRGARRNFKLFENLSEELSFFEEKLIDWLGKPQTESFFLVLAPRESGGIISRHGLISMQDTLPIEVIESNRENLLMSWVHEMGHFWFNSTSTSSYNNWIDEGLCDYCSLLLAKEKYGEEFYNQRIDEIKIKIQEKGILPPIIDISRSHPEAEILFYKYGSIIFHEMMQEIGEGAFRKSINLFAQKSIIKDKIETSDLIEAFNETTGRDWIEFFKKRISNPPEII